jgi:putative transposase
LDLDVPASRYRPSPRAMPDRVPGVEYDCDEIVRTVSSTKHCISFRGRYWKVPKASAGERVAIRPQSRDGRYGIYFGSQRIAAIDLTCPEGVSDVSE